MSRGRVVVIAGAPGAGKSTFASYFMGFHKAALLDKDTLFNPLVDSFLIATGRSLGERESEWFNSVVKPHTYNALTDAACQIAGHGCDVVITAPYTEALYEPGAWETLCSSIGADAQLIWIRTDVETLGHRLTERGLERDGDKLKDIDAYAYMMHVDEAPEAPHIEIDNRLSSPLSLESQAQRLAVFLATKRD